MADFTYKSLRGGQRMTGKTTAVTLEEAAASLRSLGHIVLEIEEVRSSGDDDIILPEERTKTEKALANILVAKSQTEVTVKQLASVLRGGVPILAAINAVGRLAPYFLRRAYAMIGSKVRKGYSLERSLREEASFLGEVSLGLIAVGEANGTLDEMLDYAAELMEKSRKVKAQLLQAFTYPAFVIVGAFGVGYYMVQHVFPKIMVFITKQSKHVELPAPTRILIQINDFLTVYGLYVLLTPVLLIILFILARRHPVMGEKIDHGILYIPLLGKAFREHCNTMWCRTLGALLRSGVDIIGSIDLVKGTMWNKYYRSQFRELREIVRQGSSISNGIERTQLKKLSPMSYTMVSVSEESGGLDESLLHVAEYSEEQLSRRVAFLGKMIEPAIFIIVGGMVGFIYFAFFMAMLAVTRSAH